MNALVFADRVGRADRDDEEDIDLELHLAGVVADVFRSFAGGVACRRCP